MGPDFLCIGPPKCGTTWLYFNMRKHPDIWLPYVKELHYFNELEKGPHPRIWHRLRRNAGCNHHWKNQMRVQWNQTVRNRSTRTFRRFRWLFRFFFFPRGEQWYRSLFPKDFHGICGEMTPKYCTLKKETIEKVHAKTPDMKIILLLRNPVERAWSHAFMWHRALFRKTIPQDLEPGDEQRLKQFLHAIQQGTGNYPENLRRWQAVFPEENIFVGFFDELRDSPRTFLQKIYTFLEVDPQRGYDEQLLHKPINPSLYRTTEIPSEWRTFLQELHADMLQELSEEFGGYATEWLNLETPAVCSSTATGTLAAAAAT